MPSYLKPSWSQVVIMRDWGSGLRRSFNGRDTPTLLVLQFQGLVRRVDQKWELTPHGRWLRDTVAIVYDYGRAIGRMDEGTTEELKHLPQFVAARLGAHSAGRPS